MRTAFASPARIALRPTFRPQQPLRRRFQTSTLRCSKNTPKLENAAKEEAIPGPNVVPPLPLWQRLGPLTTIASAYARAQKKRPYRTQFISSLIIYIISDLSAQNIGRSDENDEIDFKRTARSVVIGGIASIPSYKWFMWLSRNFNYSSHIFSLGVKIVVSQTIFTPVFNSYFFGMHALLATGSPSAVVERISNALPQSWVNSCQFWPFITAFTFTYVRAEYRSVFSGIIAIGWQTYLALLNRRAEEKARADAAAAAAGTQPMLAGATDA